MFLAVTSMGSEHGEVIAGGMSMQRIVMTLAFTAMSIVSVAGLDLVYRN